MEAWQVGLSVVMTHNVADATAIMARHLAGVHTKVEDLQKAFTNLTTIARGAFAITVGAGMLAGLEKLIDKTKDLNHEITQLNKMGASVAQISGAQEQALATVRGIKGVTQTQALSLYGQAYGMLGHENALQVMGPLAKFGQVVGNTTGDYGKAYDDVYKMLRAGDLMGKFMNEHHQVDTGKLQHFLDVGAKVIVGTHGKVDASQWLNMAQQGAPALAGMSDKGMIEMAILGQAMGGFRAGTSMMSLFQQISRARARTIMERK